MVISAAAWHHPRNAEEGRARLIGRDQYNAWRRQAAGERREVVRELLLEYGWDRKGVLRVIAAQLNVTAATICRDRQRLEQSLLG